MNKKSGFTVIEILVLAAFLAACGIIFAFQKAEIEAKNRDDNRKTAINAMYYNLEEVYHKANGYYPEKIDEKNLTAMDPQLFTDPNGVNLGEADSNYRYETTGCTDGKCKSDTLRADLEKEDDFVKTSRK